MAYNLSYEQLPEKIEHWQGFPFSLCDDEVMPLDYRAGHTGWILYGRKLGKKCLSVFQIELGKPLVIVSSWKVKSYQVVHIAGEMSKKAKNIAAKLALDFADINHIPSLRLPGLLVMDMDSTAIEIECIDELAKLAGTGEQVSLITERAMRGEMDFVTSLRKRVATLKGADISIIETVKNNLPLTPGLTYVLSQLRRARWSVAIISGGFTYFADHLKEKFKLIDTVANQLEIKHNKLTGRLTGNIVDAKFKADYLVKLAEKLNIPIEQTIAVGDGANDMKMLQTAQLGIAFHAKPKVIEKSKVCIQHANLLGILCVLNASINGE